MANKVTRRIRASDDHPTAEPWSVAVQEDPFMRGALVNPQHLERITMAGHPLQPLAITDADGVSLAGEYPSDGSGVARAGESGRIRLAADAPAFDLAGMVLVCVEGPGLGECAYIVGYDTATKWADLHQTFLTIPTTSTKYRVLINTWQRNQIHVATEFEAAPGSAPSCSVMPVFYTLPRGPGRVSEAYPGQLGVGGALIKPWRVEGMLFSVANRGTTADRTRAGYYGGGVRTDECRGTVGAKIVLTTPPASGRVLLAAGAT